MLKFIILLIFPFIISCAALGLKNECEINYEENLKLTIPPTIPGFDDNVDEEKE